MVTMLLDASNGGGSDDQAEAEMGLIWSSGGNSNDISVIVGIVIVGIVIAGIVVIVGIVIVGIVIAGMGIVIAGIVVIVVIVGIAGMGIVAAGAGTRAGLAFRPSFFRCMSCSK